MLVTNDADCPLATLPLLFHRPFTSTIKRLADGPPGPPAIKRGSLASGSIFDEPDESFDMPDLHGPKPKRAGGVGDQALTRSSMPLDERNRQAMLASVIPSAERRARWERKMVIRSVRRRGRLTRTEHLLQTERQSVCRSHWFKTSVKKLTKLARQIAGKTVDDALLQMRFSSKKAARDVRAHLEHARDRAIVVNGMGLGRVAGEVTDETPPTTIVLKNGRRHTITDPTALYIDQAWVNRGPFGREPDFRARGQINIMRPPHTGLTVLLKEEKTRIREWRERDAKAQRQRRSQLWTQLPDRKIYGQNQYYSW